MQYSILRCDYPGPLSVDLPSRRDVLRLAKMELDLISHPISRSEAQRLLQNPFASGESQIGGHLAWVEIRWPDGSKHKLQRLVPPPDPGCVNCCHSWARYKGVEVCLHCGLRREMRRGRVVRYLSPLRPKLHGGEDAKLGELMRHLPNNVWGRRFVTMIRDAEQRYWDGQYSGALDHLFLAAQQMLEGTGGGIRTRRVLIAMLRRIISLNPFLRLAARRFYGTNWAAVVLPLKN
jgi:hypothetical protein